MPTVGRDKAIERAVTLFGNGLACSEAVLMAAAEFLDIQSDIVPKIASGFGGGIGRSGSTCGALSGAIMSLGLKYGRNKPDETEAYEMCIRKSSELSAWFKKEMGSTSCYDLIQCDMSTAEGRKRWRELGLREERCSKYVRDSMRTLLNLLDNSY